MLISRKHFIPHPKKRKMADSTPLERMGRELKCPICLGILTSAVSLTCNHVFCNSCIIKSMKSASCCPVCKVPYRRREIRPSPNMDNLVSVYKSMKVSPSSIFVTQDDPRTHLSDENPVEVEQSNGLKEIDKEFPERGEITRTCKGKGFKKNIKPSFKKTACNTTTTPCFPTKKRVQVSQNPISEISLNNFECDSCDATKEFNSQRVVGQSLETNEKKEPTFPPFFWLREDEEAENLCSLSGGDIVMDTPMSNGSSFSNVMESDDEATANLMGEGKVQIESNISDCFESEMHESPNKLLVPDTEEPHQKEPHAALQGGYDQNLCTETVRADTYHKSEASKKRSRSASEASKKRSRYASETPQKKLTKNGNGKVLGLHVTSTKRVDFAEAKKQDRNGFSLDSGITAIKKKRKKRVCSTSVVETRSSNQAVNKAKVSDSISKISKKAHRFRSSMNRECKEGFKGSKKLEVSVLNVSEIISGNESNDHTAIVTAKYTPSKSGDSHSKYLDQAPSSTKAPLSKGVLLSNCKTVANKIQCAFCHSSKDSEASGEMIHYFKGKPVQGDCSEGCNVIHSHKNCTEWAPNVYFKDDTAINLESELCRSRRIKCSVCGTKGAALGCYEKSCHRSFHFSCAKSVAQCRWDSDSYVMLCPLHASFKMPSENTCPEKMKSKNSFLNGHSHISEAKSVERETTLRRCKDCFGAAAKWVVCCSGLTVSDKEIVSEFFKASKASASKQWNSRVTHVIASTDENGACKRTFKILMGILQGKWILSIQWVKACMEAKKAVNEEPYEINSDVYGIKYGPQIGRLRFLNQEPKLFDGLKFYFTKDFEPSLKEYLEELVVAAGGTIFHRKPILNLEESLSSPLFSTCSSTFIIYSLQPPETKNLIFKQRQANAEALSSSSGANAATNLWLLNSIAGSKLQAFPQ